MNPVVSRPAVEPGSVSSGILKGSADIRTSMDAIITASRVAGRAKAPPSKSYTHRAILAAGYADGATVRGPLVSADTRATMRAVDAFGGAVDHDEESGLLANPRCRTTSSTARTAGRRCD